MPTPPLLRVVIDTNVVFESLKKQGSAASFVIDALLAVLIQISEKIIICGNVFLGAGDDLVIDWGITANPMITTSNLHDFRNAR